MSNDNLAIRVKKVSKTFKLPHEKNNSIKSAVINFYRRQRSFELQKALQNISFEVEKGEFFGIVGRNGSGKSTLLKLLAGIYTPTKGDIQVWGRLTPFIELGVGFNHELTGRENVFLSGSLLGFTRKEMHAMYRDIVEFAEIEKFMDQKLKNYSSGMQVRLAFSIAIRARSDILLIDEVLAVGDAAFQQKCFNYFEELKQQKRTVVFVSHDMSAVRRFCTRAVYIDGGKMTHVGAPTEIADIYAINNIEQTQTEDQPRLSDRHKVSIKLLKQTSDNVQIETAFESAYQEEMYIGIAVLREGISVAEITTSLQIPLVGKGKVKYALDTSLLNAGMYEIGAALFRLKNRELLAVSKQKIQFVIKGEDITKGAALKLADTWQYK